MSGNLPAARHTIIAALSLAGLLLHALLRFGVVADPSLQRTSLIDVLVFGGPPGSGA